jgi:hypothetical protein
MANQAARACDALNRPLSCARPKSVRVNKPLYESNCKDPSAANPKSVQQGLGEARRYLLLETLKDR